MIPQIRAWAAGAALALAAGYGSGGPAAAGPAALTVHATGVATVTVLHLQPRFATVLRADHRVDTVAIGDPRLVTATVVRRGQDGFDLVLQPQVDSGTTNMVVWYGDLATVWDLEIGPGPRTADIVYVVTGGSVAARPRTGPGTAASPPGPVAASPPQTAMPAAAPPPPSGQAAPLASSPSPQAGRTEGSAAPPLLEVRQAFGDVAGIFQILRIQDGVLIRYRITNSGPADLTIRPGGVLVRVNGRVVPYGMARDSVDRGRPEILPRGATETGVIDAPGAAPRRVQLILSLFPASAAPEEAPPAAALPVTFQPEFAGVDHLPISPAP